MTEGYTLPEREKKVKALYSFFYNIILMASVRQLVSVISRQRLSVQAINTCQRSMHTSAVRLNSSLNETPKKNFSEILADKFIGQVQGQGNKLRTVQPTRFVRIDNLPVTATSEDVNKLAREALPQGDKSIIEGTFFFFRKGYQVIFTSYEL